MKNAKWIVHSLLRYGCTLEDIAKNTNIKFVVLSTVKRDECAEYFLDIEKIVSLLVFWNRVKKMHDTYKYYQSINYFQEETK